MLLKIVQLTDIHIGEEDQLTFEANARSQFLWTLDRAVHCNPDLILLTGDLCLDEPVAEIYPWVKEKLDATTIPYEVIAGNHDSSTMLANTFNENLLKNRELYYSKRINDHFIVFLDSALGRFSDEQWDWLSTTLKDHDEMIHIVMHHPPIYAGVPFLDAQHAFHEQQRFFELINSFDHDVHVYCGHYHTARYIHHGNVHIHICPSTLFQMNTQNSQFAVDSTIPGMQLIILDAKRVETQILWCNE